MFLLFTVPCRIFLNPLLHVHVAFVDSSETNTRIAVSSRFVAASIDSTVNSRFETDNEIHSKAAKYTHRGIEAKTCVGDRLLIWSCPRSYHWFITGRLLPPLVQNTKVITKCNNKINHKIIWYEKQSLNLYFSDYKNLRVLEILKYWSAAAMRRMGYRQTLILKLFQIFTGQD